MNELCLFSREIVVDNPSDLTTLVTQIKQAISDHKLQQVFPENAPFQTRSNIADFTENGPWPADYIEWYCVSCVDKKLYRLSVETYHGMGGRWQSV